MFLKQARDSPLLQLISGTGVNGTEVCEADGVAILLRPAASHDSDFLWWLHRETMRDYVDKTWGWDEEWQRTKFDENFDPETLEIIENDVGAIGYISVKRLAHEILLAAIEVAPEHQNRGIGTRIIRELLRECDHKQVSARLRVLKVNPARRLYTRLGFQCIEETSTHYVMIRKPVAPSLGD